MKVLIKCFVLNMFLSVFNLAVFAQESFIERINTPNQWVENHLKRMRKKKRIAQMFFIRSRSNGGKSYNDSIAKLIKKEHLGGVVFFQGGPVRQAHLSNRLQENSKIPLLIAMDAEWGLGMRLDSTISYPYQMALGAIQDHSLLTDMGKAVADDFHLMGMHLNFAPVVDVNNNPRNPVINFRSFGENKENVIQKSAAYMSGMQSQKILTSIKHFPGHGDTEVDSHLGLPILSHDKKRLMSLEIAPFRELVQKNASAVMVAHLSIPSLDSLVNVPATLSYTIITELLKNQLKFKGLVITDAMEMKAISNLFMPGIADLKAVEAGNDIIELSENVRLAIKTILKKARTDKIFMNRIDESVRKILLAKYWTQDTASKIIETATLHSRLNSSPKKHLQSKLAEASMTLIKGKKAVQNLRFEQPTALINISNSGHINAFQKILPLSFNAQILNVKGTEKNDVSLNSLLDNLGKYTQIILSITDERSRPAINLPFSAAIKAFVSKVCALPSTHLVLFANPYCLDELKGAEKATSICIAYQKEIFMQNAAAKIYTKKLLPTGKLPVSINTLFPIGMPASEL